MNWGYKILFVYLAFVGGMVWMVIKSSSQKMDLVTTDYYAKELKYQDKIDEAKRTSALSKAVECTVVNSQLSIKFPEDFSGKEIKGDVHLYCPSDEDKDLVQPFTTKDNLLTISLPERSKGSNEVHISWTVDNETYYFEKKIFI
ncbi:FixH family protein [Ferruginibacter sp. SUN002]|uniref:FixH family protein n=1 Tax=Ferruginibacter sp. SUN002 TaxID=2937789 RepID=UPI003D363BE3